MPLETSTSLSNFLFHFLSLRNYYLLLTFLNSIYSTEVEPEEEKPKKGSRSEVVDRWGHDMFDATEQGPKSNNELVDSYGYDIRVEEGAPR